MLQAIIFILASSFILYTLLGGADFGAGIIETFVGKKGEKEVSKAMAPVWEANHVWLILAIVIIFTGFPTVYAVLSLYLHIPLMIVLFGIILRGSAFVFRFYDVSDNRWHGSFGILFKASSFITPIFLGITLGAMLLGEINMADTGSFYERFIHPWFNGFCFTLGLFVASLFTYIAAIFLTGETKGEKQKIYIRLSKSFLLITFFLGGLVIFLGETSGHHLFKGFLRSPISLGAIFIVILLIPIIFYLFMHLRVVFIRAVISLQVTLIILAWFAIHFPVVVYEKNGNDITFFNAAAPEASLYQLLIALVIGLVLVIPGFFYLFRVFKN